MKAEEKQLIFNLLKTAASANAGYVSENFRKTPVFTDDLDKIPENQNGNGDFQKNKLQNAAATSNQSTEFSSNRNQDSISGGESAETAHHPSPESHGLTIADINSKIARCTRCQLARTRNNVVPGTGVEHPLVMVIGEGPGYDEDMQGLPFVGKAGMLLDKMLAAIQLSRNENCYIANIVKCRPPQNRDPQPEEQNACFSFLENQIHILKPKMILCMGRIAGQKLLNTQAPVGQLRGNFYEYNGIPLMITYHPSALLRNEALKRPAWEDLKKFKQKLDSIK